MDIVEEDVAVPLEVLSRCKLDPKQLCIEPSFAAEWNTHAHAFCADERVRDAVEKLCYYTVNEQVFRDILVSLGIYW